MAEDVYIAGLGAGVPEWSNEATQQQVLNALNSGFSSNVQVNRQIMTVLSKLSTGETKSSNLLADLVISTKETADAVKKGSATNASIVTKQTGFLASLTNILSDTNRTAKKQLDVANRIAEYEKLGLTTAEANLRANIESSAHQAGGLWGDIKTLAATIGTAVGFINTANSKTIEGATSRYDMAQEMRQSGLLAGMDSAGAGLIGLSKTISRSNFTFGEAAEFTRQFSQAVGITGVKASMEFANRLAKSGEGNSDMMRRFGMEFSEVAEIAGSYMESVRSIGQLDKLSDNQMRMGMDNFMDTVVSTSNVMKINLQDAANMIADTLKQDQFASQLALMEPEMRKNVEAMVGRFGGEGTILGTGIATAMAAGSTQDFLQTDVAQQLQGDVIGQKLLPLITQMAETARTQGPEAANALYATMGPQFDAIIQFARDNKGLVNLNKGMIQALITQIAAMRQTVGDADKGEVPLSKEDKAIINYREAERYSKIVSEANETLVLNATDLSRSLNQLVQSSLILTREVANLGAGTASARGEVRKFELAARTVVNMTAAGGVQFADLTLTNPNMGFAAEESTDVSGALELKNQTIIGQGGTPSARDTNNVVKLEGLQAIRSLADQLTDPLDVIKAMQEMEKQLDISDDPEKFARAIIHALGEKKQDDSYLPGNYWNSDVVQAHNAGIDKLITSVNELTNALK